MIAGARFVLKLMEINMVTTIIHIELYLLDNYYFAFSYGVCCFYNFRDLPVSKMAASMWNAGQTQEIVKILFYVYVVKYALGRTRIVYSNYLEV